MGSDTQAPVTADITDLLAHGLAAVPFAALLFRPDENLTLLWRNSAHERMSMSEGRSVTGLGMFEAFPPSGDADGSAAVDAIRSTVARMRETRAPEQIGPYRFDLPDDDGAYSEYHWQMHFAPIFLDGRMEAILQTAQDVTEAVLTAKLAASHRRTSTSTASVAYFTYDPATDLFHRHPSIDAMFGFAADEAGSQAGPFFERVHPDDLPAVYAEVARITAAPLGEIASFDYRVPQPDGTERFIRIRAEMATDPIDRRPKLVGTFVDLTDIEQNRRRLARAVELREALVYEANHRINNSLQIALSMLRIEAGRLIREGGTLGEKASAALRAVESRIRAVAEVHGLMQVGETVTTTDLGALFERLVRATRQSAELPEQALVLTLPDTRVTLDSNSAVPLGLMVNELLTNAIKYGRPDAAHPIRLTLAGTARDGLTVTAENAQRHTQPATPSTGLGERLVTQFAEQIGASVRRSDGDTFRATITLPPLSDVHDA
ncbi:PAS domain S-box protein [Thalassococcus sp. CAU 1522]|uniref:histidine kinase n=1 Tax=Thalassococcus arenae TaxID=2851652 RepID=A0ABS6N910_9RHOB|nr:histidine kinase dimerization/phosphoacceptor domain -containing protein [Thalassococcus arenae]MBV2360496.1 PAS domain S-box protein [Thalassococcus arenae]